ncbi:hypothetical protein [Amphritea sp.]|uniref:hypothetical protein n=1 Tax=Amphritea sp. TaxID=1872502 RepID=UPI0025BE32F3|nr:hypothetical protein [Amphritea sp.]
MESLPSTVYVAIGAFLAAAITAAASLVSLIASKEMKISELRQCWIESLRNEISEYIGIANRMSLTWMFLFPNAENHDEGIARFLSDNLSEIERLDTLMHKVLLKLNPKEHQELIDAIKTVEKNIANPNFLRSNGGIAAQLDHVHDLSQAVLKKEWDRVKDGEGAFVKMKEIVSNIALISMMLLIVIVLGMVFF